MAESDDLVAQAGEYVLGTLARDERAAFAGRIARDRDAARLVREWEQALAPLADGIAPEAVSPAVWAAIERRIGAAPVGNDAAPLPVVAERPDRWRNYAIAASLVAAALGAWTIGRPSRPPLVIASAPVEVRPELSVAALNAGGSASGLLLTVDEASGEVVARTVSLAQPDARSLQLWWIEGRAAPAPLGLLEVGATQRFRLRPGAETAGTTFAISVEPVGGSPTGAPTGPITYTGQAVRLPGS